LRNLLPAPTGFSQLDLFSILETQKICSSETSWSHRTTSNSNPEHYNLHTHCRQNFKSNILLLSFLLSLFKINFRIASGLDYSNLNAYCVDDTRCLVLSLYANAFYFLSSWANVVGTTTGYRLDGREAGV
jgi:hypothetical protein